MNFLLYKLISLDRSIPKWSNYINISWNYFSFESYITLPGKLKKKMNPVSYIESSLTSSETGDGIEY